MYFLTIAVNECRTTACSEEYIRGVLANPEGHAIKTFLDSSYAGSNPNYWPEGAALLVKGEVIMPTPVEAVTSWKLP